MLTFVLLLLAGTTGLFRRFAVGDPNRFEFALRTACALLAVWLSWRLVRLWRTRPVPGDRGPGIPQPSIARLMELQSAMAKRLDSPFTDQAVATFVGLITSPARYRSRVIEVINFEERIVTQQVAVEFTLPQLGGAEDVPRFVPLFSPPKGQLVDNLRITDGGGKPLADLSFDEATELVAAGLRFLIQLALQSGARARPGKRSASDSDLNESHRALELILLEQLTRRGFVDAEDAADVIDSALARYPLHADAESLVQLRRYVLALSVTYPIVAVVPKDAVVARRALLRYERTLIPAALTEPGLNLGWLRVLLGLKPYQVVVPAQMSLTASSFHLYVSGPSNKYVLGQNFRCRWCRADVSRSWEPVASEDGQCSHRSRPGSDTPRFTDVERHFRVSPRRGQNFVHLYTRGFGDARGPQFKDLELFARFKETPPGSRATALVTALVSAFLLAIVGRLASTGGTPPGSLPALILALPAAAATWFGFSADSKSLVGSSLLARLSQILTAVVSAVAIAVSLTSHDAKREGGLSILGITEPWWVGLFLVSMVNVLYVSYRFAVKVQVYTDLLKKRERHGPGDAGSMGA